ncbi:uncharacterized protein LOC112521810 [Cynara cardunculus var. scolymus]|uniref:uncharacterized protein LOC112521810 n=1 Tax=Cynara cardunculus var. scolymus TaxID=59895 RepID=UPI000D6247B1|nr:uncharacterized protein LOC112521810 [Cynara cardunculus var. scolymus]
MCKSFDDYNLPMVDVDANFQSREFHEVQEECFIVVEDEHLRPRLSQFDKKYAYDVIMRHVDNDCPGVFFIDGLAGTGKTFLYKTLLANIHSGGLIALATASSGVVANNMPRGRTTHSQFKIPLNLDNNSMYNIKKTKHDCSIDSRCKNNLLGRIIDGKEADSGGARSNNARHHRSDTPIWQGDKGNGGDFRLVLSVVTRGTRAQIIDSSLWMSSLWSKIKKIHFNSIRPLTDPLFSDLLLRVGDGDEETLDERFIHIPDDMSVLYTDKVNSKDTLIDATFLSLQINGADSNYIILRAILSTKNENVDEINDQLIDKFCRDEKIYYSFDEVEDDKNKSI